MAAARGPATHKTLVEASPGRDFPFVVRDARSAREGARQPDDVERRLRWRRVAKRRRARYGAGAPNPRRQAATREARGEGARALVFALDVTNSNAVDAAAARVVSEWGRLGPLFVRLAVEALLLLRSERARAAQAQEA